MQDGMNKFKIGDIVRCIVGVSEQDGGPKEGEIFFITSIDNDYAISIGFPLERLKDTIYHEDIRKGLQPNWGISCFVSAKDILFDEALNGILNE